MSDALCYQTCKAFLNSGSLAEAANTGAATTQKAERIFIDGWQPGPTELQEFGHGSEDGNGPK